MCPIDGYEAYNVLVLLALSTSIDILYIDLKLKTDRPQIREQRKRKLFKFGSHCSMTRHLLV